MSHVFQALSAAFADILASESLAASGAAKLNGTRLADDLEFRVPKPLANGWRIKTLYF